MSNSKPNELARDQRPFHICPDCSAYNSKARATCWRCERDMTQGALDARGKLSDRLGQLDSAKPATETK
jgi:hypothetical protein